MNKNPCCGKCNRFNSSSLSSSVPVGDYYCINPGCECHAVKEVYMQGGSSMSIKSDLSFEEDQSNEWRERFKKEFPDFRDERGAEGILGTSTEVVAFIASEKQKSYVEGAKEFQKMGVWYDKGIEVGRAALLAEVIAELPKEMKANELLATDVAGVREEYFNKALSQVRALLESKLSK